MYKKLLKIKSSVKKYTAYNMGILLQPKSINMQEYNNPS